MGHHNTSTNIDLRTVPKRQFIPIQAEVFKIVHKLFNCLWYQDYDTSLNSLLPAIQGIKRNTKWLGNGHGLYLKSLGSPHSFPLGIITDMYTVPY